MDEPLEDLKDQARLNIFMEKNILWSLRVRLYGGGKKTMKDRIEINTE